MTARPAATDAEKAYRRAWANNHPDDPRHGTASFHEYWGCQCLRCRLASSARLSSYRARSELNRQIAKCHTATPYTVSEHRAFGEPLCLACTRFIHTFRG